PGMPVLPFREIRIGIPEKAAVNIQIIKTESEIRNDILVAPAPYPYKDRSGMSNYKYIIDETEYNKTDSLQLKVVHAFPPRRMRNIMTQRLRIHPFRYNPLSQELTIITSVTIKITYPEAPKTSSRLSLRRDRFESMYPRTLLNYDRAKNWRSAPASIKSKQAFLPAGDWYQVEIKEDGIYKITPQTLQSAGIDITGLNINAIQMFNNGGRYLSHNVQDNWYNPPYSKEIPLFIKDQNSNNIFDGNDYLLFFGKNVNGWFYNPSTRDIEFSQHPFANANQYLLSVSGSNGLRMQEELLENLPSAPVRTYYIDRFHFEEDINNILSSGPDWYGKRFIGLSDSYSKEFSVNYNPVENVNPYFRIKFKGGSRVEYGDNKSYRYYFTIAINNQALIQGGTFTDYNIWTYTKTIISQNTLLNGSNSLKIAYWAKDNIETTAYLDWFEVFFSTNLNAQNNYINFYTDTGSEALRYTLTGYSAVNDIFVLDVTDATVPKIIQKNLTGNQPINLDIPQSSGEKNLIAFSLSSAAIKSSPQLKKIDTPQDLLAIDNSADFIIITHQSFVSQAYQIAQLRSPELTVKVVTTDDIYVNFNTGVQDPTAIRNFIRYAYYNWQPLMPAYVLLFGDGHYDYRHIQLSDSIRVPSYEIYDAVELNSRTTDNYYVDTEYTGDLTFTSLDPELAIGRIPVQTSEEAEIFINKLKNYENNPARDGWQTVFTFVGDDRYTTPSETPSEVRHQNDADSLTKLTELIKFNIRKIYLSTYQTSPGGVFGRIKPTASRDLIDHFNEGSLIINYLGHGSPTQWAHEELFVMQRDLSKLKNDHKLAFVIAATCDFGKYDNPDAPCFSEKLVLKENGGAIGVLSAARLVDAIQNSRFNEDFYQNLYPNGNPSVRLGDAWREAVSTGSNDQKFHLFADPTMYLNDPRGMVKITEISSDTLRALSTVTVNAEIQSNDRPDINFNGGAYLIVNDARYDSIDTNIDLNNPTNRYNPVILSGPYIFKGELSVNNGMLEGNFIVPKSIRYKNSKTGRATLYAWNEQGTQTAMGYVNDLLFIGSESSDDSEGPEIDIYFKDHENFLSGDLIKQSPMLIAEINDESGINITGEVGHTISMQIDNDAVKDISDFFSYEKDSYTDGKIEYPMDNLTAGEHTMNLQVYDNVNNPAESAINFRISTSAGLDLQNVVNYPNPFKSSTKFTFQTNSDGADVTIKIYTLTGRLIQELYGSSNSGYNDSIEWNGRDRDGDKIANGVYLYKIILSDGQEKK
ncbi:MAG: type IX secretion system sortase PorU, partial [Calditrichaceae bacterium]